MKKKHKTTHLKKKLLVFIGCIILVTIFIHSTLSYFSLSKAYDTAIAAAKNQFDTTIRTEVETLVNVLQVNYDRAQKGEISETEAMENAKNIVRGTRYNNGEGYFWADTADGICAVHMNAEYEGKNRLEDKDLKGEFYVQKLIAAGEKKGGGFTDFYFTKPGASGEFQKRAYTAKFAPYEWYISTGNYQVDIDAMMGKYFQEKIIALAEMVLSSIIIFIIGIFLTVRMAKSITDPLEKVTNRIRLLSEGDLHTPVPQLKTDDETKILADATEKTVSNLHLIIKDITTQMEQMSEKNFEKETPMEYVGDLEPIKQSIVKISHSLSMALSQISQSAGQVASGSASVSSGAQILAQGTEEQANAVEMLSVSAVEISEQVKQNAEHAAMASHMFQESAEHVEKGKTKMQQMTQAMSEINASSNEIGKIIHTIDDIAFQTNILALNASVEAARAGAAGKGFAVVAEEVRNLATRSAEAAKNTTNLIEHSLQTVENGSKIADETAGMLLAIVESTEKSAKLIGQISQASNQQADSVARITQGVEQISSVIQTNSATAEESAASSEELSSQAEIMLEQIRQFKLKNMAAGADSSVLKEKTEFAAESTQDKY